MKSSRKRSGRVRIGKVSVYLHHGAWWLYYREGGKPVRKKVSESRAQAEQLAAQVNAQLALQSPTSLSFTPIAVAALRMEFLGHHEHVRKSSLGTVRRYQGKRMKTPENSARFPISRPARIAVFYSFFAS